MAWFPPAAAAAAPLVLPYYHRCVPGRCFYGPDGQHHLCSMGVNVAQPLPQPIIYGNGLPNVPTTTTLPRPMRRRCVGRWVRGQQRTAWMPRSSAGGQKTTTPYPPRLQAHRDGSVPGLEYIPVLRDGWADYSSRTNHAVAPPSATDAEHCIVP
ncbi:hypothetical protein PG997_005845 [Apiospora hydei]|uniref:Secreted protein n=1 Tax=Apiospora hydei TaxID=1337664 RepID=A0ABR1WR48_9PEZI